MTPYHSQTCLNLILNMANHRGLLTPSWSIFTYDLSFSFSCQICIIRHRSMGLVQLVSKFKVVLESHIVFENWCTRSRLICSKHANLGSFLDFSQEVSFSIFFHFLMDSSKNMGLVQLVSKLRVVKESHMIFDIWCILCKLISRNMHFKAIFLILYLTSCFIIYVISKTLPLERWDLYS